MTDPESGNPTEPYADEATGTRMVTLTTASEREERRETVWEGLLAGKSYRVIGAELGVSHVTVMKDARVLRRRWAVMAGAFEEHARLDLARIEKLIRTLWPQALTGGKAGTPDKFAIDRIVVLLDRKARLLGLDKPAKVDSKVTVEHTTTTDLEIRRLVSEMAKRELDAAGA